VTDSTNTFYSAFAQAELALHERVKLTLGGRYDSFERESRQENGVPLVEYPSLDGQADHWSPKAALSVKLGGYSLLNAALSYRPGRGKLAGVTLTATNLLDEEYYFFFGGRTAVYDAVPGVPFQARLPVDLRF
jgi:outer membrane receptor protein involved in Fe transport